MQAGDRVKLTDRGVFLQHKQYMRRARRVDWAVRRGTLTRIVKTNAYVKWDGRKTLDLLHSCLIVKE